MTLSALADEIYRDIGEPSETSVPAIVFWLSVNLGKLNVLTEESFQMEADEVVPDMDNIQQAILKQLYLVKYWSQKTNANLGAAAYDSAVLEITEGDRTTRLVNRNEIAKNFLALKRDANDDLLRLITAYKLSKASPRQVIGDDTASDSPYLTTHPFRPYSRGFDY